MLADRPFPPRGRDPDGGEILANGPHGRSEATGQPSTSATTYNRLSERSVVIPSP